MKILKKLIPAISIIIPVYNEEQYIVKLLESIKKQDYPKIEIIIADADSTDKSVEKALEYNAVVVPGGTPALGRNNGAMIAKGEYLMFIDADVILPEKFISNAVNSFDNKYYEIATFKFLPLSDLKIDELIFKVTNIIIKLSEKFHPLAPGFAIMCTKRIFRKVNGFNEDLKLGEDHDFVEKSSKFAKFGVIEDVNLNVSIRRFEKEGRMNLVKKYINAELFRSIKGKITDDKFDYIFAEYESKKELSDFESILESFLQKLSG
jgi:glycosyltransferase involved in cell wall biosynthesis